MNSVIENTPTIEARLVPESERASALAKHFGGDLLAVESAVYAFMRRLARDYAGGYWSFFELSNGGFYLAPQREGAWQLEVDTNGFEGAMSTQAAGITVCLFALSHLSFARESARLGEHYHLLREFALEHPEARAILAAID